jgi:hypothetical protein
MLISVLYEVIPPAPKFASRGSGAWDRELNHDGWRCKSMYSLASG